MKALPDGRGIMAGVAGMGRSGAAAARLLTSRNYRVTGFDSSPSATAPEHIEALVTGEPSIDHIRDLALMVVSPGVPPGSPVLAMAHKAGVPVVGEIELAFASTDADILGVTGSNGKTTTVEWLGHLLRSTKEYSGAVVAGNMGYAFCDAVLDNPVCNVFVLELSSYQLETITDLRVNAAAILNLTPDHLERHGTMENYGSAKARIFMNQMDTDTAVLNNDDPLLEPYKECSRGRTLLFSLKNPVSEGAWLDRNGMLRLRYMGSETEILHSGELGIPGMHNVANALAVTCIAASAGVSPESVKEGLSSFRGVPHRIESLGRAGGMEWVNDSKSTNTDSLRVALESFDHPVILLAGGLAKESDYSVLKDQISRTVKFAVLFGAAGESLKKQWENSVDMYLAADLEEAVSIVLKTAVSGDTVLLSPGCASFDQYRNFEERGDHFRRIVGGIR